MKITRLAQKCHIKSSMWKYLVQPKKVSTCCLSCILPSRTVYLTGLWERETGWISTTFMIKSNMYSVSGQNHPPMCWNTRWNGASTLFLMEIHWESTTFRTGQWGAITYPVCAERWNDSRSVQVMPPLYHLYQIYRLFETHIEKKMKISLLAKKCHIKRVC